MATMEEFNSNSEDTDYKIHYELLIFKLQLKLKTVHEVICLTRNDMESIPIAFNENIQKRLLMLLLFDREAEEL